MSRKYSDFDIRMKKYEKLSDYHVNDDLPIVCRLDGRAFHTFTKGLPRPYSESLHNLMVDTCCNLMKECNANFGYTQSDEISLILLKKTEVSELYFKGRIAKMCSVLASLASSHFNKFIPKFLPEKEGLLPLFDCRVFNVPSQKECLNYLIWRQRDATRNSIQMAGQAYFSHKQLHGKDTNEIQEMLFQNHQVNWNDYPEFFKRGSLCKKVEYKKYTNDALYPPTQSNEKIWFDGNGYYVYRSKYARVDTPIFKIPQN